MNPVFNKLRKYKRAYVVCAVGQSYINSSEGLIKSLCSYSQYPIILYYSGGVVNYTYENLIIQPFRVKSIEVSYEHGLKLLTTLKSEVLLSSIKNYDLEYVVLLDSDIIPTKNIDSIFNKYEDSIENYPIFIKYAWDVVYVLDRPLVSDYIQSVIECNAPKLPAICSCLCIANKNCISFLEDWKYWCQNEDLLKYHYVDNSQLYFDFNDESIANALLWKYNATQYIPCNLMWACTYESVKYAFDFYDNMTGDLPIHESTPHYRVPSEYEVPTGLSVLPFCKKDLLGFHGLKELSHIDRSINEIEKRF